MSVLCCGFLNESCLGCACGRGMEASDELCWEEGVEGLDLEQSCTRRILVSLSPVGGRGQAQAVLGKVEGKDRDAPSILIRPVSILAVPSSRRGAEQQLPCRR